MESLIWKGVEHVEESTSKYAESHIESIKGFGFGGHHWCIGQTARRGGSHDWEFKNGRNKNLDADWGQSLDCKVYCYKCRFEEH